MRFMILLATALFLGTACTPPGSEPASPARTGPVSFTPAPVLPTTRPTAVPTATSAPTAAATAVRADLPDLGPAPAWSNEQWINSKPLSLADLRGKVVLLEFWTFG